MSELTQERVQLLSKLYNLKSDDSILIEGILENQRQNDQRKQEEEGILYQTIDDKEREQELLTTFDNQANLAFEAFGAYNNDSFNSLSLIGVDFQIGDKLKQIEENKDVFIDKIQKEIDELESRIEESKKYLEELEDESKDIENELDQAKQQRDRLKNLIEDILNNENDSYNRGYVRTILEGFRYFSADEISTLEYLILFPENGLIEFDNKKLYENPENFVVAPEATDYNAYANDYEMEQPVEETTEFDYAPEMAAEETSKEPTFTFEPVQNIEPESKEVPEEVPVTEEESVISPIIEQTDENNGIFAPTEEQQIKGFTDDFQGFPSFEEFLARADEKYTNPEEVQNVESEDFFIEKIGKNASELPELNRDAIIAAINECNFSVLANYELLKVLELDDSQIFAMDENGYMYLTDPELIAKVTTLRGNGINDKTIKEEIINGNFTASLEDLNQRINALKNMDNSINQENINQVKQDLGRCEENVKILNENGIDLEDKEVRNYMTLLSDCTQIQNKINYLKDYSIKLVRKNGKYALETFWKEPKQLAVAIDDLLEANLERLIEGYPEVLGKNSETIQRRIKFCLENNIQIVDENNPNVFYKYIYDEVEFRKTFGNVELPTITTLSDNNNLLDDDIGNQGYTSLLVDTLNSYYNDEIDDEIELDEESFKKLDSILTAIPSILDCTVDGLVYKVGDSLISKNKLERNAAILVSTLSKNGIQLDGLEKEIVLVSALYNTRLSREILNKIIKNCLGTTEGKTGGINL